MFSGFRKSRIEISLLSFAGSETNLLRWTNFSFTDCNLTFSEQKCFDNFNFSDDRLLISEHKWVSEIRVSHYYLVNYVQIFRKSTRGIKLRGNNLIGH